MMYSLMDLSSFIGAHEKHQQILLFRPEIATKSVPCNAKDITLGLRASNYLTPISFHVLKLLVVDWPQRIYQSHSMIIKIK